MANCCKFLLILSLGIRLHQHYFRYLCSFHRAVFQSSWHSPLFKQITKNQYIYDKESGTYDYGQTIVYNKTLFYKLLPVVGFVIYIQNGHRYSTLITAMLLLTKPLWIRDIIENGVYFPGILANNSIKIKLETEKQNPAEFLYGSFSSLPVVTII